MQADGGIRVAARIAVFQVATDGTADVRQLATDLVMSPGKQLYLEKIESV